MFLNKYKTNLVSLSDDLNQNSKSQIIFIGWLNEMMVFVEPIFELGVGGDGWFFLIFSYIPLDPSSNLKSTKSANQDLIFPKLTIGHSW